MRFIWIGAAIISLLAGTAQAQGQSKLASRLSVKKVAVQTVPYRTATASKLPDAWVLHNPYKPETMTLTFGN